MSSPVDGLQCLAWEPHSDADGLLSEDAARLAWQTAFKAPVSRRISHALTYLPT